MPLAKDKLFLRAGGNYSKRDGFVRNEFNGKDLQNLEAIEGNFRLKYFASDRLTFSLLYNVQYRESDAYAQVLAFPENGITFQDILRENPYSVSYNEDIVKRATTSNIALNTTVDFGQVSLTSVTALQTTDRFRRDDFDFSPDPVQVFNTDIDLLNFTQEFRLASTETAALRWTTGVFLFSTEETDDGTQASPQATTIEKNETTRSGLAVFGQASYALNSKLKITSGLRFDYENVEGEVDRSTEGIDQQESFREEADFTAISPRLALSYQLQPDIFLFANVARGYRPGGVNTIVSNAEDAPFDPEITWNYEAGIKTTFSENRLKLNLTGFWINYTDQQILNILDISQFLVGTENIGKSRSFGLELETQALITQGLSVNLNAGYLHTEILDYTVSSVDVATFQEVEVDESGNELPVSPEFNGNVNVNYILPITQKLNLEASLDYIYQSEIFWDPGNVNTQEAYGLLNARLGVTSKNIDVFFWSKNLTDKEYFVYGFGTNGFNAATYGLPRTYGVTLTGKF